MSIANIGMENHTHECQQCGMKFYNSAELVNHIRKFCSGAGLNSLEGLAQYEHSSKMPKQLKNYGAQSLGSMKYEPVFDAVELAKEAKHLANHRQQLAINRPYSNVNSQAISSTRLPAHQNTFNQPALFERSVVKKVHIPQTTNSRAVYGQRVLGASEVSMQSIANFQPIKSKSRIEDNYYSPPSDLAPLLVKRNGPSVLDKSNSSIAKMSVSQKQDYATDKLVELDNIASLYDKSGGMSMDFRKNLQKMRKFYHKMLQDDQPTKVHPTQLPLSRVQTPINRLRDLNLDQGDAKNDIRNQPKDSLDLQLKSRPNRKAPPQADGKKNEVDYPNMQPNPMAFQGYPFYPSQYQFPPQPQIIMMPPYQQTQGSSEINEQIKYFQKVIEVKNEENKKLMEMLLETKKEKNQSQVRSKVEQIRQSRISSMRNDNAYHMETPMETAPLTEEKILLALQREQLDELRLLSSLPQELQQLKMQSVMKLIEQRTQLEKQILQQKVRRLEEQKRNQLYEENVRLEKDNWANEERKKLIAYQMGDVLEQFKRKVNGENDSEDEDDDDEFGNNQEE